MDSIQSTSVNLFTLPFSSPPPPFASPRYAVRYIVTVSVDFHFCLFSYPFPLFLSFSMLFRQSLIFRLQLHVDGGTAPAFITRAQSICIFSSAFYGSVQRPARCREYVGDHISYGRTQQRGLFVIILHIISKGGYIIY